MIAFTEAALIYDQFFYNIAKGFSIKIEIPDYLDIYFKQFQDIQPDKKNASKYIIEVIGKPIVD